MEADRGVLATSTEDLGPQLVTDAGPHSECQGREGRSRAQCQQGLFDSNRASG